MLKSILTISIVFASLASALSGVRADPQAPEGRQSKPMLAATESDLDSHALRNHELSKRVLKHENLPPVNRDTLLVFFTGDADDRGQHEITVEYQDGDDRKTFDFHPDCSGDGANQWQPIYFHKKRPELLVHPGNFCVFPNDIDTDVVYDGWTFDNLWVYFGHAPTRNVPSDCYWDPEPPHDHVRARCYFADMFLDQAHDVRAADKTVELVA